jgi:hypothetical protein
MYSSRTEVLQTVFVFGSLPLIFVGGVVAILLSAVGPFGIVLSISFMAGVALIVFTKLRVKKRINGFFEWGLNCMTSAEKIYYLLGYILCVFACLSSLVLYLTGINRL